MDMDALCFTRRTIPQEIAANNSEEFTEKLFMQVIQVAILSLIYNSSFEFALVAIVQSEDILPNFSCVISIRAIGLRYCQINLL